MNNVVEVECNVGNGYKEWVVNTKDKWCSFALRKNYSADTVFVLETDEDGGEYYYLLKGFSKKKIPFFNQEKDQIIIVTVDGYEETI